MTKNVTREQAAVAEYLSNGGKINPCPPKLAQGNNFTRHERRVLRAKCREAK